MSEPIVEGAIEAGDVIVGTGSAAYFEALETILRGRLFVLRELSHVGDMENFTVRGRRLPMAEAFAYLLVYAARPPAVLLGLADVLIHATSSFAAAFERGDIRGRLTITGGEVRVMHEALTRR